MLDNYLKLLGNLCTLMQDTIKCINSEIDDMYKEIEDLQYQLDNMTESYNDLQNDLESNYRPISQKEMYEQAGDFY